MWTLFAGVPGKIKAIQAAIAALGDTYVVRARSISAGTGLSGGGNLTADRTLSFHTTWGDARYAPRTAIPYALLPATGDLVAVTMSGSPTTVVLDFGTGVAQRLNVSGGSGQQTLRINATWPTDGTYYVRVFNDRVGYLNITIQGTALRLGAANPRIDSNSDGLISVRVIAGVPYLTGGTFG
tara:strand:- start:474 stop:1019 length:546 start_codon:yes stop_codon:yes gene_type:complete